MTTTTLRDERRRQMRDAFVGLIPHVGSFLVASDRLSNPTDYQKIVDKLVEAYEERISPISRLSELAFACASSISQMSKNGESDPVEIDGLLKSFPEDEKSIVEEALYELKHYGFLLSVREVVGNNGSIVPAPLLFLVFDTLNPDHDWSALSDFPKVVKFVSGNANPISCDEIQQHFGWEPRRLNPYFEMIGRATNQGRVDHPPWAYHYLWIPPERKHFLSDMAEDISGLFLG